MMLIPTVVIMLPLSSLRDIGKLSHTSLLSMILVLVILGSFSRHPTVHSLR
jgi:hypothetical protein